jgi:hypothetical protein
MQFPSTSSGFFNLVDTKNTGSVKEKNYNQMKNIVSTNV